MVSRRSAYATGIERGRPRRPRSPTIEDRLTPKPVDPDARRQCEQEERQELDDALSAATAKALASRSEDRDERQRELRDLRAELADRLRDQS